MAYPVPKRPRPSQTGQDDFVRELAATEKRQVRFTGLFAVLTDSCAAQTQQLADLGAAKAVMNAARSEQAFREAQRKYNLLLNTMY